MYQAVFPPPWIPSLTALAALCVCDFLRTEYKSAALVKASPVSRKLAVHRSKQNSVISAFPPSKCTFVPWYLPFHPLILWLYSFFFFFGYLSWALQTNRYFQPSIFICPLNSKDQCITTAWMQELECKD